MKYLIILICLSPIFIIGTTGIFTGMSFAENEIEVIVDEPPESEEEQPFTHEMIDQEDEMLEQIIHEISEAPVEEFGSMVQKRKQRAYYTHRLKMLRTSPEKYFKTKSGE